MADGMALASAWKNVRAVLGRLSVDGDNVRDPLVTAAGVLAISALLFIFYAAVRTEWPTSYVSASADVGLIVNRNICRYLAFMFVPTYVVTLLVSTTVSSFGGTAMACALGGAALHLARTQVVHYFKTVVRIENHTRLPSTLVVIAAMLGTLGSAALGGLGPGPFTAVVPPIDEFFKSLWTTIFVALLAVAALRISRDTSSADTLVKRSRQELGEDLIKFARDEATRAGADPVLVEGILLTENLQRPRWIRRLERWKGLLQSEGTYGIMQVHSDVPMDDKSSVRLAISKHLSDVVVRRDEWGFYDEDDLRRVLSSYNPSADFVEVAQSLISEIYYETYKQKQADEDSRTDEEKLQERVTLALTVWKEMARRIVTQEEGVVDIARLSISDLRTMADIVERLPAPRDSADEAMRESAQAALRASDLDGTLTSNRTSDSRPG
ncbi:hypothetical protein ABZ570_13970 [Micromonospora sp. NPDC007271]|uniref:hypothetical protein n=1 Tax=Micromonospora sp. NPDC007271 TaxID=3154587 RepID=UPI0033E79610